MLSVRVLQEFCVVIRFLEGTKGFLFSWDASKKSLIVNSSLARRVFIKCLSTYVVLYNIHTLIGFIQFYQTGRISVMVMDGFWCMLMIFGHMSCNEGLAQAALRRNEMARFFKELAILDKIFDGNFVKNLYNIYVIYHMYHM